MAVALLAVPLAIACIAGAQLSPFGKTALALVTATVAGGELRLHLGVRARRRVRRAVLGTDGSWHIVPMDGPPTRGRLARAWGISAGPVIALEWNCDDGQRRQAWLVRRQVPACTWRRLRVRLRFA